MAAQRSSADANAADELCLITDADLTQFNSCLKHSCQIFYQFTEVNPAIRSKIKQHFIVVKSVLCVDQFHFQLMFPDLFLTDAHGILFFFFISGSFGIVLRIGNPDHGL